MTIYVIPTGTIAAEATSILTRSEVPIITDGILMRKFMKAADVTQCLITLTEDEITVMTRNAAHLVEDAPMVLVAVPGLSYPGPWMHVASRMHSVDWLTLEASLTKAGFVANDVKSLDTRAKRDDVIANAQTSISKLFADDDDELTDPLGDQEL